MSDVTAILLSLGESTRERARQCLSGQTLAPAAVVPLEGVRPFAAALNQAAAQVATPYCLQVDADMLLDPGCLAALRDLMDERCSCVIGHLRDPLVGRVVGIKLCRTDLLQRLPHQDGEAPELDWLARARALGFHERYALDYTAVPWHTFGSHEPEYAEAYTHAKHVRTARGYLLGGDWAGIRHHLRLLLASEHPARWSALLGMAAGLAGSDQFCHADPWEPVPPPPVRDEREAFELGYDLGRLGRPLLWTGDHAWLAALGAGLGLQGLPVPPGLPLSPAPPLPSPPPARPSRRSLGLYRRLHRWLGASTLPSSSPSARGDGVGYCLWRYPSLSETFIRREIDALRAAGVRVEILAIERDPACPEETGVHYRRPARLGGWLLRRPRALWRCWRFLMGLQFSYEKSLERDRELGQLALWLAERTESLGLARLHAPWADPCALAALLAARLTERPCTAQVRSHELNRPEAPGFLPVLIGQLDAVVTGSDLYQRLLAPRARRLERIYEGLDLREFPKPQRAHRQRPEPYRILCVARLIPPKGLETLLAACDRLRQGGLSFRCTIIGGPEEPLYTSSLVSLKRQWRRLGLESHVSFLGPLPFPAVLQHYREHDVFALPSRVAADGSHDMTPNCILEAMATELPVVSTTVGAIPELVEHESSAWLVEPERPDLLAEALLRLWDDQPLRSRLATAARQRCQERFSSDRLGEQLRAFFTSL